MINVYTIPPSQPFLRTLAGWVLAEYGQDAAALTKVRILLPGRRACRSLQEAFLELSGGKPLLLPKIEPIGEIVLPGGMAAMPPPVSPMRRQLLLMRLISEFEGKRLGRVYNMQKAAELAGELIRFVDEVAREEIDFSGLGKLVPEELARHWQETVDFLQIISLHWPRILEKEGVSDPVSHRNHMIRQVAAAWQKQDPGMPVIAAGSTGSQPATAALLGVIAKLAQGRVILPGLDTAMEKKHWDAIGETHPQYLLRQLLESIECPREAVQALSTAPKENTQDICLRQVFYPATATSDWKEAKLPVAEGLSHIHILEAETLLEEARLIGALLREALETPGKTAALVTPDRTLARMAATQMQRFGVQLDDSAGRSLAHSPAGVYLRLVVKVAASGAAPVDLLALLRHPLAAVGVDPAACRLLSRELELLLLRGVRMQSGFAALRNEAKGHARLEAFLASLEAAFAPLLKSFTANKPVSLKTLLEQHIACAESLAAGGDMEGRQRLWAKESGNHLAAWLAELLAEADTLMVEPVIYPATFAALLAGQTYWPRQTPHPRLSIVSPIEARLQHYNRVILAGMNEKTWPTATSADPWMSRPMRSQFGLPLPERSLGQAAHDIAMLARAPEVFFTRARKVNGQPTVPSRWLVRLETLVQGKDPATCARMKDQAYGEAALAILEKPLPLPLLAQPKPVPPLNARPRRMRVTHVDDWLADPYTIYARYVLRLKALDALDCEPSSRDFGTLVHQALQRFTAQWPQTLPDNPREALLTCGREMFTPWLAKPAVMGLWWPRFELISDWLVTEEKKRRGTLRRIMAEVEGRWKIPAAGGDFELATRIDRLEFYSNGSVALIDYKTGSVPSENDIRKHKKNQLPLEALVMLHGSLQPALAENKAPSQFEYWKLGHRAQDCEVRPIELNETDIENTRKVLQHLIDTFDKPDTAYTAADDSPGRYNDYEQLTRRAEWEAL